MTSKRILLIKVLGGTVGLILWILFARYIGVI